MSVISFYFNQILTAINKWKIISEVVLLQPNTDRYQQVEDYAPQILKTDRFIIADLKITE
jgi:hypothetical protein